MSKYTVLRIDNNEFAKLMHHVPALTLEELMPKLTANGLQYCTYKNSKETKPYRLGVFCSPILMNDYVEKIQAIAGKRFKVDKMPNQQEIFITLK